MPSTGTLLCLASAAAFGAMGIFGKLAYDDGATVSTLLAVRFALAAVLFWLFMAYSGRARALRALPRRDVAIALALGGIGYSAQAGAYFAALDRIDASLLALLVYTYPTIVTVAAIALGRERANRRTAAALVLASTGLVLVLAGAGGAELDPIGTGLGLAAAVVYSVYILTSEGVAARIGTLALSTLVCTGAATTLTLAGLALGDLNLGSVNACRAWLAGRPRRGVDGRRDWPLLRRAPARGLDGRVHPVDPGARRDRRACIPRVRRVARNRAARRGRARPDRSARGSCPRTRPTAQLQKGDSKCLTQPKP